MTRSPRDRCVWAYATALSYLHILKNILRISTSTDYLHGAKQKREAQRDKTQGHKMFFSELRRPFFMSFLAFAQFCAVPSCDWTGVMCNEEETSRANFSRTADSSASQPSSDNKADKWCRWYLPRKGKHLFIYFFNTETRSPRVTSSHPLRGLCVFVVGVH